MKDISVKLFKERENTVILNRINYIINYIVLVLLIEKISSFGLVVLSDYYLNLENTLNNYYTFPIIRGTQPINDNNQLQYNELLDTFYEETEEVYKTIIMDCNNYMSYAGEKTLAQQYNQLPVTVNEYYLEINPIHDLYGNEIGPSQFKEDALNILIPDTMELCSISRSQSGFRLYQTVSLTRALPEQLNRLIQDIAKT